MAQSQSWTTEPVAIVGTSCRFPGGVNSPSKLWQILQDPPDLRKEIPLSKFNQQEFYHPDGTRHGSSNVSHSYLLEEDPGQFDHGFFNLNPKEAESMDPSQRILLETVYEGIESAGYAMSELRGSFTGVFVGQMTDDYYDLIGRDVQCAPQYTATGTSRSIVANRVSYFFDWRGPSVNIDTACSSSLVALHQAVQALRSGESKLAVAAGVNLILGPEKYIYESQLSMLSPTGRSRMWDANADGYARGEGFVAIVLKPLSQALAHNDHIECIIRDTGVNQDGRSEGLTVPSSTAQTSLIHSTYRKCGLDWQKSEDRCQYFEAHGTGTQAGDPKEARAIQQAFFPKRDEEDSRKTGANDLLYVGSIKTVVGHLEGAAGLAGLLKASLAVQRGQIPPNLHFNRLNPSIEPFYNHLQVPTSLQSWPELSVGTPRRASINSFGFGGTNAHAIIESWGPSDDTLPRKPASLRHYGPFTLSAGSSEGLKHVISALSHALKADPTINLQDLAWTLQLRREHFPVRAAIAATDRVQLIDRLDDASKNAEALSMQSSQATRVTERYPTRILGIFTGQGAQWPSMGAGLYRNSACFRQSIQTLQASLEGLPDPPSWSVDSELLAAPDRSRVKLAEIAQPLCTAVQIAIVDLLRASGISFHGVVGHSSGEIAAAYAAGYLDASDAIRIAYYRGLHSRLSSSPTGQPGKMMAVGLSFQDAEIFCQRPQFAGRIQVAASNARASVTVSGDGDAIQEAKAVLNEEKVFARALYVDQAYHSRHMEPCAGPYMESLRGCGIKVRRTSIHGDCTWYSSVHGSSGRYIHDPDSLSSQYWVDNLVRPVMFSQALDRAVQESQRFDLALEIGPHPALRGPATDLIKGLTGISLPYSGVLKRNEDDLVSFSDALGFVWKNIDSPNRFPDFQAFAQACESSSSYFYPRVCKDLPTFPWDHTKSMLWESRTSKLWRGRPEPDHDLLGVPTVSGNRQEVRWRKIMRVNEMDWLRGHKFQSQVLFPAAGYVSMAVEAASYLVPDQPKKLIELNDIQIHRAITLSEQSSAGVEVIFTISTRRQDETTIVADYSCFSIEADAGADEHSHCNFTGSATIAINTSQKIETLRPQRNSLDLPLTGISMDQFYSGFTTIGLDYSGDFLVNSVHRRLGFATVSMSQRSRTHLRVDPAVLDASFHGVFASFCYPGDGRMWTAYLPTSIRRVRITPVQPQEQKQKEKDFAADCMLREASEKLIKADVNIHSAAEGGLECQLESLTCTSFKTQSPDEDRKLFSRTVWRKDLSSGIEGNKTIPASHDDVKLYEVLERTSYFFLRRLRAEISASEVESMTWNFKASLGWAFDRLLPSIEKRQHPRVKAEWHADQEADIDTWQSEFPDDISLRAVRAIGQAYPDIVRGNIPALQILMEDGVLDRLYKDCVGGQTANTQVGELVGQLAHRYPQMNILEIGAGTGGTTETALKCLQSNFASYVYTDISPGFFEKAAASFSDHAHKMLFKTLDIERDPVQQGFEEHSFDVIMAANVLHATKSLETTVANCHKLLRPGGHMILLEITSEALWIQTIFSALPGWWLGQEEGRMNHPTVSIDEWGSILSSQGFSGVDVECRDSEDEHRYTFSVFTSQALDQRVDALRSPLDIEPSDSLSPKIDHLAIIGPEGLGRIPLVTEVEKLLSPFATGVTLTSGLADPALAKDKLPLGSVVISLVDLEEPTFQQMNPVKFQAIKTILDSSKHILWATRGCRSENPYANIMVGLGRSVMQELTHIGLQFVDLYPATTAQPAALLSNILLRMLYADDPEFGDVLWSNETEISIQDGNTYIPRILPEEVSNQRVNSGKRIIQRQVNPWQHAVTLKRESPSGVFSLEQTSDGRGGNNCPVLAQVRVHACSLFPIVVREGEHQFVCLGTCPGSGETVLTLAPTSTSVISVPSHDLIPTSQSSMSTAAKQGLVQEALTRIIYKSLIQPLNTGSTLWLHGTDASIANVASEVAVAHGVELFWTSSDSQADDKATIPRYIHPFITERELLGQVPASVRCMVTIGAEPVPGFHQRLASCLSKNVEVQHLASHVNHTGQLPVSLGLEEVQECLRAAARLPVTEPFTPAISVDQLPTNRATAPHFSEPLDIVNWESVEHVSATVKTLDAYRMFSGNKTYFLVGLTGDVGLSLCDWMINNGARHLALSSRKPNIDSRVMREWERKGANVRVFALDVTDQQMLRDVQRQILETMPPIGGVANAAMVLRDSPFSAMALEDFDAVLGPKVRGSENLDKIFYSDDLDFFILFSSLSRVIGNPGQSNYAAANMFMASLAAKRRARGVSASVVDIAMLVGFGWMWRNADELLESQMKQAAYMSISEPEFHTIMAEAIDSGRADRDLHPEIHTGLAMSNTASWKRFPRFSHFVRTENQGVAAGGAGSASEKTVQQQIKETACDEEVLTALETAISHKLRLVLQLPDTGLPIDPKTALLSLGIDSLVAVELRSWFLKELAVDVPTLRILSDATIEDISIEVKSKLGASIDKPQSTSAEAKPNSLDRVPSLAPSPQNDGVSTPNSTTSPTIDLSSSDEGRITTRPESPISSIGPEASDAECTAASKAAVYERTGDMSYSQEALHFLHEYLTDKSSQNVTFYGRYPHHLDINKLEDALQQLGRRHESLRSAYFVDTTTNRAIQAVRAEQGINIIHRKIKDESEIDAEVQRLRHHTFDIENGHLMTVAVLSESPDLHYIVFVHHHIVLDAAASIVFLEELTRAYAGQPLNSPAPQAIDVCARRRAECTPDNMARKLSYWKSIHDHPSVPLPLLPFARTQSRRPLHDYDTETFDTNLDAGLCSLIRKKASELRVTPFHFYLSSFTALLGRCLGSYESFNIGIVDSNRGSDVKSTRALGCHLNLLPLRFHLEPDESFESLARKTRDTALEALSNAGVPFEMLLDHLKVPRHSTHHPMFQLLVNYRLGVPESSPFGDGQIEWKGAIPPKNAYDLVVDISDTPRGACILSLTTQKYLYSAADTKLLMKWYTHALKEFAQESSMSISSCPLADQQDMIKATALGCGPTANIEWEGTLIDQVERITSEFPDSTAIKDDDGRTVSYSDVMETINFICRGLQARDIQSGSKVAVILSPKADTICTLLAVLRFGLVWVPLDLRNHQQRLAVIVADCEPSHIIYSADTKGLADELVMGHEAKGKLEALPLEELLQPSTSSASDLTPNLSSRGADAAILYTSGSTGVPKGVRLTHVGLLNQIYAGKLAVGAKREVVLQQTSFGFDMALDQIFQALAGGGLLIVVGQQGRGDPEHITKLMLSEGVTYTHIVPSEYHLMFQYGGEFLKQCRQWRIAHAAGEKVTHHLRRAFQVLDLPGLKLFNSYGPTETTVTCARGLVPYLTEEDVMAETDSLRSLPNYNISIVDDRMMPVPSGVPGEICISSQFGISPGYNNNPGETERRFSDSKFPHGSVEPGVPVYRTGDLGRLSPQDGTLTVLGRIQDEGSQVKIRGQRVELDEIAASIVCCSKNMITNAAVSWRSDAELLVALVVFGNGSSKDKARWAKQQLGQELPFPPYMRPSVWIPVSGIPTNANGKADRRVIDEYPVPSDLHESSLLSINIEQSPPSLSEIERQISKIWCQVLGEKASSIVDSASDFFFLGGNSRNLIDLRSLMERQFAPFRVPLPKLFQHSSLGEMATLFVSPCDSQSSQKRSHSVRIDWNKEVAEVYREVLHTQGPFSSSVQDGPRRETDPDSLILILTGATGFLGSSILQRLVEDPRVHEVHCIAVRHAKDRARRVLVESNKIIEHHGNLESPLLGLSEAELDHLSNRADMIIHNGAQVSFLKSYQSLRQANVSSTIELCRLALARSIPLHFVSTGSVALVPTISSGNVQVEPPTLSEQSAANRIPEPESQNGYRDTKWVAEVLLETLGAEHGLPVWIHRPTSIVGDGAPKLDMMASILNFSRALGKVPSLEGKLEGCLDLVSVQDVSGRLVDVALSTVRGPVNSNETTGFVHHCSDRKLQPGQLKAYLEEQDGGQGSYKVVGFQEWVDAAAGAGMDPLIHDFLSSTFADGKKVRMPSLARS